MTTTAQEKSDTITGRMTRLNGGTMELIGAGAQLIATVAFNNPSGTVAAAVGTFSGFPKTVTPALFGTAIASAQIKDSGGVLRHTGLSVGLAGSGAQVILSKLTPVSGDTLTVNSPFTMTEQ